MSIDILGILQTNWHLIDNVVNIILAAFTFLTPYTGTQCRLGQPWSPGQLLKSAMIQNQTRGDKVIQTSVLATVLMQLPVRIMLLCHVVGGLAPFLVISFPGQHWKLTGIHFVRLVFILWDWFSSWTILVRKMNPATAGYGLIWDGSFHRCSNFIP